VFLPEEEEDDGFGLGKGIRQRPTATELGFEDEDDFLIDDDLVASGGEDLEWESGDEEWSDEEGMEGEEGDDDDNEDDDDDDDEFTAQLLTQDARAQALASEKAQQSGEAAATDADGVPLAPPCPQTLAEFAALAGAHPADRVPALVQRIRAAHHPKLDAANKEKLNGLAAALVDWIALPRTSESPPFAIVESVVRHVHSLAKTFCNLAVSRRVREHVAATGRERPLALHSGDLVLLAAVAAIFPTSDHFHQVVTPAMLVIGRFLGQKVPATAADLATGAFCAVLALQYQRLAKRFVPELVGFCLCGILAVAPAVSSTSSSPLPRMGDFPLHAPPPGARIVASAAKNVEVRKLSFADCEAASPESSTPEDVKVAIAATLIQVLDAAAEAWATKPSFVETFLPATRVLDHLLAAALPASLASLATRTRTRIGILTTSSAHARRPLELHHHRPLAIKSHAPKFEQEPSGFDPRKHYDPDRERAELARLRAEHKRERKGAMRELRRDNAFVMRENLRVKKARDDAYERKHARILAEIQTEAGQEANEYAREKKARLRANKRARG
jgi:nucleolar protein 14